LDCENLREARFAAASSLTRAQEYRVKGGEWRRDQETHVEKELGKDRKNCLCVVSCKETTRVAKRSRVSWKGER
jgi:hypothetical protein